MPRFEASALRGYCVSVLTASGVERSCAEAVADALIDAELTGVSTHGVSRLAVYMQRMDAGVMSRENNIRIVRESTSTLVVDAGNSLGAAAAKFAMERCIAKAKETGCCFASVHSSNHFGTAAYYTRLAAAQDMIGFACTNLKGKIAPFGSAEPYMGTNPISVAAPSDDLPVVLDMAPSVVALGKLILAQKLGKSIPEGWALDKDGRPTTDPAAGRAGSLVPIGGAKGSGLAIMVDVLCGILSGGPYGPHLHDLYVMDEPQGVSHFLGAIDIAHFIEPAAFKSALSAMSREIKALKKADGVEEIFLPGERSGRKAEENAANGIEVPQPVYEELLELGKPYGLSKNSHHRIGPPHRTRAADRGGAHRRLRRPRHGHHPPRDRGRGRRARAHHRAARLAARDGEEPQDRLQARRGLR